MSAPSKFAFLDEGEALRRLGVDRDTLQTFVSEKRLRAYPGVGKGSFFRVRDVDALLAELHADKGDVETPATSEAVPAAGRKLFDPSYKVHVRLQADLKWYDLEDEDFRAWAREMTPDGYARQRTNITRVIEKLQRLIALMDEAAAGWQTLTPEPPVSAPAQPQPIVPTVAKKARKPLPMATDFNSPQQQQPAPKADTAHGEQG